MVWDCKHLVNSYNCGIQSLLEAIAFSYQENMSILNFLPNGAVLNMKAFLTRQQKGEPDQKQGSEVTRELLFPQKAFT